MLRLSKLRNHPNVQSIYFRTSSEGGDERAAVVLNVWTRVPNECKSFFGNNFGEVDKVLFEADKFLSSPPEEDFLA